MDNIDKYFQVIFWSMVPIVESRGSIPWGISGLGLPPLHVAIVSIISNFLITLPVIYLLKPISEYLRRYSIFERFFNWFFERSIKKGTIINKYKILGLIIFIGIPLPVTGAWTGCVAAYLFGFNKRSILIGAFFGVIMSVFIITAVWLKVGLDFFEFLQVSFTGMKGG